MLFNLEDCTLFNGLKNEEINTLLNTVLWQIKKFKKDDFIVLADDDVNSLLIVIEGSVKGEMTDFSGKTIKIEDIESSRPLAPAFLFGKNNKYPVTIVANNKVQLLSLSKSSVLKLMHLNEYFLQNFLNNISNRAQFLSGKIKFLSFQSIKGKIAHYLLQLQKKTQKDSFIIPHSQNQLAEMFAVTRPSLSRVLRRLHNEVYIEATGRKIKILNKQGLAELVR